MPYAPEHDEVPNPLRVGLRADTAPEPCVCVVFGASGDLAHRKLLPALYNLTLGAHLPAAFGVVGVSKTEMDGKAFIADMRDAVGKFSRTKPIREETWSDFADGMRYVAGSFDDPSTFTKLKSALDDLDKTRATRGNRLFYFATPPSTFGILVQQLEAAGLISDPNAPTFTRVVIEKPFGRDLTSARALNKLVLECLDERQIFRIDHYLGKETVQNLLTFRFANSIFEPIWNRKYVNHVQITAGEELGVELRGKYYEEAGIVRDMIQNHVLQLVTLTAMEPPVAFDADALRDEKIKVLRAIHPMDGPDMVRERVVLGQYTAGSLGGTDVPGYQTEPDIAKGSRTPTYVALKLMIDNWRWQGVPFYVRSGKRMPKRATEIAVHFDALPHGLFGAANTPNVLVIRVQPEEGIALRFAAKVPGERYRPRTVSMDFRYGTAFGNSSPEAYERLLLDAIRGDQSLFTRKDEVEAAWKLVDSVLKVTEAPDGGAPFSYPAGTWGPNEADRLLARDGRAWRRL
ncbi:MAG: glucose-6-phosphate dehydrogenase [Deltaproteobacteria bacterium]|nr:glucose-6-phosphate dehydrogenase [Deltaproteobacteria bacterium]